MVIDRVKRTEKFERDVKSVKDKVVKEKIKKDKGVNNLIKTLQNKKHELVLDIFGSADVETMEKISNLNWGLIEYLIEFIGWLALSLEYDVVKEIEDCCC